MKKLILTMSLLTSVSCFAELDLTNPQNPTLQDFQRQWAQEQQIRNQQQMNQNLDNIANSLNEFNKMQRQREWQRQARGW